MASHSVGKSGGSGVLDAVATMTDRITGTAAE
jgi:hypothetical protein